MRETLTHTLDLVLPHLSAELAAPEQVSQLRRWGEQLPPGLPAGFEIRLAPASSQVDLLLSFSRDDAVDEILQSRIETSLLSVDPVWKRVHDFCVKWGERGTLFEGITKVWLEFDLDPRLDAHSPVPSIFLTLSEDLPPFPDALSVVRSALPLFFGTAIPPSLDENVERCFHACRDRAFISHVGFMLARSSDALRLNIPRLQSPQIHNFLRQAGWTFDTADLDALVDWVFCRAGLVTMCLDVGEVLLPKIGFECSFDNDLAGLELEKCWLPMLGDLVARELCTPAKSDSLLRWQGWTFPTTSANPWSPHLVVQSLGEIPGRLSSIRRRLSHIKLVAQPNQPLQAKAYIGFEHLWLRPDAASRLEHNAV